MSQMVKLKLSAQELVWARAAASNSWVWSTQATGSMMSCTTYAWPDDTYSLWDTARDALDIVNGVVKLPTDRALLIEMPNGSAIELLATGNFRITDKDAKVTYMANTNREFNPYVSASDLLGEFIRFVGRLRVARELIPQLPLGLFVNWLVIEAARRDNDPVPSDVEPIEEHRLLKRVVQPRCLACQRFVRRALAARGFQFCNAEHAGRYYQQLTA